MNAQLCLRKTVSLIVAAVFSLTTLFHPSLTHASSLNLPPVGTLLTTTSNFSPVIVRGLSVYADDPMKFDFIIDTGTEVNVNLDRIRDEADKQIKYFLAALTIPTKDQWVNLSPYENNRIVEDNFGVTEMGKDLLAQDYILKQLMASLSNPEDKLGKDFWERVYTKAQEQYGNTNIPLDTFNKVWITPDKASVYEHGNHVFVLKKHLKVMLEEDYMAMQYGHENVGAVHKTPVQDQVNPAKELIKEILIPELEREVNEGEHFAVLRQVYNSMILATWFKMRLKQSILGQAYVDQKVTEGINDVQRSSIDQIYQQYLDAYKIGVYDLIKEDYDPATQQIIPKKYFSGGIEAVTPAMLTIETNPAMRDEVVREGAFGPEYEVKFRVGDRAMLQAKSSLTGFGQMIVIVAVAFLLMAFNSFYTSPEKPVGSIKEYWEANKTNLRTPKTPTPPPVPPVVDSIPVTHVPEFGINIDLHRDNQNLARQGVKYGDFLDIPDTLAVLGAQFMRTYGAIPSKSFLDKTYDVDQAQKKKGKSGLWISMGLTKDTGAPANFDDNGNPVNAAVEGGSWRPYLESVKDYLNTPGASKPIIKEIEVGINEANANLNWFPGGTLDRFMLDANAAATEIHQKYPGVVTTMTWADHFWKQEPNGQWVPDPVKIQQLVRWIESAPDIDVHKINIYSFQREAGIFTGEDQTRSLALFQAAIERSRVNQLRKAKGLPPVQVGVGEWGMHDAQGQAGQAEMLTEVADQFLFYGNQQGNPRANSIAFFMFRQVKSKGPDAGEDRYGLYVEVDETGKLGRKNQPVVAFINAAGRYDVARTTGKVPDLNAPQVPAPQTAPTTTDTVLPSTGQPSTGVVTPTKPGRSAPTSFIVNQSDLDSYEALQRALGYPLKVGDLNTPKVQRDIEAVAQKLQYVLGSLVLDAEEAFAIDLNMLDKLLELADNKARLDSLSYDAQVGFLNVTKSPDSLLVANEKSKTTVGLIRAFNDQQSQTWARFGLFLTKTAKDSEQPVRPEDFSGYALVPNFDPSGNFIGVFPVKVIDNQYATNGDFTPGLSFNSGLALDNPYMPLTDIANIAGSYEELLRADPLVQALAVGAVLNMGVDGYNMMQAERHQIEINGYSFQNTGNMLGRIINPGDVLTDPIMKVDTSTGRVFLSRRNASFDKVEMPFMKVPEKLLAQTLGHLQNMDERKGASKLDTLIAGAFDKLLPSQKQAKFFFQNPEYPSVPVLGAQYYAFAQHVLFEEDNPNVDYVQRRGFENEPDIEIEEMENGKPVIKRYPASEFAIFESYERIPGQAFPRVTRYMALHWYYKDANGQEPNKKFLEDVKNGGFGYQKPGEGRFLLTMAKLNQMLTFRQGMQPREDLGVDPVTGKRLVIPIVGVRISPTGQIHIIYGDKLPLTADGLTEKREGFEFSGEGSLVTAPMLLDSVTGRRILPDGRSVPVRDVFVANPTTSALGYAFIHGQQTRLSDGKLQIGQRMTFQKKEIPADPNKPGSKPQDVYEFVSSEPVFDTIPADSFQTLDVQENVLAPAYNDLDSVEIGASRQIMFNKTDMTQEMVDTLLRQMNLDAIANVKQIMVDPTGGKMLSGVDSLILGDGVLVISKEVQKNPGLLKGKTILFSDVPALYADIFQQRRKGLVQDTLILDKGVPYLEMPNDRIAIVMEMPEQKVVARIHDLKAMTTTYYFEGQDDDFIRSLVLLKLQVDQRAKRQNYENVVQATYTLPSGEVIYAKKIKDGETEFVWVGKDNYQIIEFSEPNYMSVAERSGYEPLQVRHFPQHLQAQSEQMIQTLREQKVIDSKDYVPITYRYTKENRVAQLQAIFPDLSAEDVRAVHDSLTMLTQTGFGYHEQKNDGTGVYQSTPFKDGRNAPNIKLVTFSPDKDYNGLTRLLESLTNNNIPPEQGIPQLANYLNVPMPDSLMERLSQAERNLPKYPDLKAKTERFNRLSKAYNDLMARYNDATRIDAEAMFKLVGSIREEIVKLQSADALTNFINQMALNKATQDSISFNDGRDMVVNWIKTGGIQMVFDSIVKTPQFVTIADINYLDTLSQKYWLAVMQGDTIANNWRPTVSVYDVFFSLGGTVSLQSRLDYVTAKIQEMEFNFFNASSQLPPLNDIFDPGTGALIAHGANQGLYYLDQYDGQEALYENVVAGAIQRAENAINYFKLQKAIYSSGSPEDQQMLFFLDQQIQLLEQWLVFYDMQHNYLELVKAFHDGGQTQALFDDILNFIHTINPQMGVMEFHMFLADQERILWLATYDMLTLSASAQSQDYQNTLFDGPSNVANPTLADILAHLLQIETYFTSTIPATADSTIAWLDRILTEHGSKLTQAQIDAINALKANYAREAGEFRTLVLQWIEKQRKFLQLLEEYKTNPSDSLLAEIEAIRVLLLQYAHPMKQMGFEIYSERKDLLIILFNLGESIINKEELEQKRLELEGHFKNIFDRHGAFKSPGYDISQALQLFDEATKNGLDLRQGLEGLEKQIEEAQKELEAEYARYDSAFQEFQRAYVLVEEYLVDQVQNASRAGGAGNQTSIGAVKDYSYRILNRHMENKMYVMEYQRAFLAGSTVVSSGFNVNVRGLDQARSTSMSLADYRLGGQQKAFNPMSSLVVVDRPFNTPLFFGAGKFGSVKEGGPKSSLIFMGGNFNSADAGLNPFFAFRPRVGLRSQSEFYVYPDTGLNYMTHYAFLAPSIALGDPDGRFKFSGTYFSEFAVSPELNQFFNKLLSKENFSQAPKTTSFKAWNLGGEVLLGSRNAETGVNAAKTTLSFNTFGMNAGIKGSSPDTVRMYDVWTGDVLTDANGIPIEYSYQLDLMDYYRRHDVKFNQQFGKKFILSAGATHIDVKPFLFDIFPGERVTLADLGFVLKPTDNWMFNAKYATNGQGRSDANAQAQWQNAHWRVSLRGALTDGDPSWAANVRFKGVDVGYSRDRLGNHSLTMRGNMVINEHLMMNVSMQTNRGGLGGNLGVNWMINGKKKQELPPVTGQPLPWADAPQVIVPAIEKVSEPVAATIEMTNARDSVLLNQELLNQHKLVILGPRSYEFTHLAIEGQLPVDGQESNHGFTIFKNGENLTRPLSLQQLSRNRQLKTFSDRELKAMNMRKALVGRDTVYYIDYKDAGGNPILDDQGRPIVEEIKNGRVRIFTPQQLKDMFGIVSNVPAIMEDNKLMMDLLDRAWKGNGIVYDTTGYRVVSNTDIRNWVEKGGLKGEVKEVREIIKDGVPEPKIIFIFTTKEGYVIELTKRGLEELEKWSEGRYRVTLKNGDMVFLTEEQLIATYQRELALPKAQRTYDFQLVLDEEATSKMADRINYLLKDPQTTAEQKVRLRQQLDDMRQNERKLYVLAMPPEKVVDGLDGSRGTDVRFQAKSKDKSHRALGQMVRVNMGFDRNLLGDAYVLGTMVWVNHPVYKKPVFAVKDHVMRSHLEGLGDGVDGVNLWFDLYFSGVINRQGEIVNARIMEDSLRNRGYKKPVIDNVRKVMTMVTGLPREYPNTVYLLNLDNMDADRVLVPLNERHIVLLKDRDKIHEQETTTSGSPKTQEDLIRDAKELFQSWRDGLGTIKAFKGVYERLDSEHKTQFQRENYNNDAYLKKTYPTFEDLLKSDNAMLEQRTDQGLMDKKGVEADNADLGGITMDSDLLQLDRQGSGMAPMIQGVGGPVKPMNNLYHLIIDIKPISAAQLLSRLDHAERMPWDEDRQKDVVDSPAIVLGRGET